MPETGLYAPQVPSSGECDFGAAPPGVNRKGVVLQF